MTANEIKDDESLNNLMHDLFCSSADNMHYPELKHRQEYFRKTENGEFYMCDALTELFEKYGDKIRVASEAEGRAEGEKKGKAEGETGGMAFAIRNLMKSMKISVEDAMDMLGIPDESRETCEIPATA